ncbi:MAG: hypothetical protein LBT47_12880 [Deltaproteobacteria bacterium]|jgi:hypothetical protein|nr:hypothetical protein [Deltaproteobacteria bacterium]
MNSTPKNRLVVILLSVALVAAACAPRYEFKPVPVRQMSNYPNRSVFPEGLVGAVGFSDSAQLKEIFGFDLKKAGVIPVQIRLENMSSDESVVLSQALVFEENGQGWEVLPSDVVYNRINEYTSGGFSGEQGVRRTLLWGLAGGIIGAAVGVATGTNVGEAAGKGAAIGGAAGAASSIAGIGVPDQDNYEGIYRDFSGRSLDHVTIAPGETANGMLYFPSEAKKPVSLHLVLKTGSATRQLELKL